MYHQVGPYQKHGCPRLSLRELGGGPLQRPHDGSQWDRLAPGGGRDRLNLHRVDVHALQRSQQRSHAPSRAGARRVGQVRDALDHPAQVRCGR